MKVILYSILLYLVKSIPYVQTSSPWASISGKCQYKLLEECSISTDSKFVAILKHGDDFGSVVSSFQEINLWDLDTVSNEILQLILWQERRVFSGWKQAYQTTTSSERNAMYRGEIEDEKLRLLKAIKDSQWPLSFINKSDVTEQQDLLQTCQQYTDISGMVSGRSPDTMKMSILAQESMKRHLLNFIIDDRDAAWAIAFMNERCLSQPDMYRNASKHVLIRKIADTQLQLYLLIEMKSSIRFIASLKYLYSLNRLPNVRGLLFLYFEASEAFGIDSEAPFIIKQILLT